MAVDLRDQLQLSLGEAYRIERELGGGGMSRVFLALETSLNRRVVVKVLLPELAAGVSMDRFRREIHLAAQLQHPHIVPLLATGDAGGLPYFTMPYVDGESLRARLLRDGDLPVAEAIRVLRDIASALAYAHALGVVHRDIKPDNVLLSHGVAVVTDFGVAKALTVSTGPDARPAGPGLTSLGITLGTPAYMAPEQGAADPAMDHRVDIYAFGATAYEILTGQPPFTGRSPQAILGAHIAALPEPIATRRPGMPPLLAQLIMRCLEKRPSDRPQTAGDVMSTLDLLTTPSGGTVPVAALRRPRRDRWAEAVVSAGRRYGPLGAVLAVVVAVAFWAWPRRAESPPAQSPPEAPVAVPLPPPAPPPAAAPGPATAETTAPAPAPPRPRPSPPPQVRRRPEPTAPAPSAAKDSALLAGLGTEAAGARARAVTAGAGASEIARGDSSVALAESLAAQGRTAEAAARLSTATALWSSAAEVARAAAERATQRAQADSARPPPPPARPPDSVPVPAPDPARLIRTLFAEYGAAIEARSVEAIRGLYPGLLPQQAREWEEFFQGVSDIKVELDVTGLKVTGDAAEARLAGVYVFHNPSTHRTQRENVAFQASLRREGGRWRIASLR